MDGSTAETRFLGRSGLRVSTLTLGTMTFGGSGRHAHMGTVGVDEATRMVDLCLDHGVNLFDTADVYSAGLSEEVLGQALGKRRQEVLVATKLNGPMGEGPNDRGQSRHHIIAACEASLRRLGTDYIDLYQVHSIDERTPFEESLRALDDLVRQGKVRYIGCSNYSAWHLMKALSVSDQRGFERYVSLQAYYSLVARELEHELLPLSQDQGVGVLVWSPLAGGFLAGKQRRGEGAPAGTRRAVSGDTGTMDLERGLDIVDELAVIAKDRGVSVAQVAINWLIARPGVSSVIVGARNIAQLEDNLGAAGWQLTAEEVDRLDRVSAATLPYPFWHQQKFNGPRMRYTLSGSGQEL
ncbi:MAG TPA: aldo/keto reductase [Amycolatopsis sp.]|jgi:aryl-alcohol dehydrogenase-like predicted oxidoreductase|nr:aldo/keto reductase [Amycolatopsis sp.]